MKPIDLLRDPPARLFGRYVTASISATFVTSIYIIVDTIMIGRGVGADALVALNLILPFFSLLFAFGVLLGVGGGVLLSVANGAGDSTRAQSAFSTALMAAVAFSVVLCVLSTVFLQPLSTLLGADSSNRHMVMEYGGYIVHFAPVFVFSTFLQALIRNDRHPRLAMIAVLSGAVLNIVLDAVFIFTLGMGMAGGALATVLGNALTVCILLTHFFQPCNTMRFSLHHISFGMLRSILTTGMPVFLTEAAQGIITFAFNRQLLRYLGAFAVVIYGIIANCAIVCMSIFNGVAQASQPIVAANYGAGHTVRVHKVGRMALGCVLLFGIALASTAYWMPHTLLRLFVAPTPDLYAQGTPVIQLYFLGFVPMGCNLVIATYFQSTVQPSKALLITLLRGVCLPLLLVLTLPKFVSTATIWATVPLTESITLLIAVALLAGTHAVSHKLGHTKTQ